LNVTAGALETELTVNVTETAAPVQLLALVSVTKTVVVLAAALLKANCAFVGEVVVANKVDKLTSLYHRYVLPPTGEVMEGGVIGLPTQYVFGLKVTAGAAGIAFIVNTTGNAGPLQLLALVSVTNTVVVFTKALLKPIWAFVGADPVVKIVVSPASLNQV